jgi:hypothetical protein
MSEANNIDDLVAQDPYYLWRDLPYDTRLPRDVVAAGLSKWLEAQLAWIWDQQTEVKIAWYLARRAGLRAWCLAEAYLRLSFAKQDSFTAAEFCELHFAEELREHKQKVLADPFWNELFDYKRQTGDLNFFTHLPILVHQSPYVFNQAKRLFCVFWDRLEPPYEYWSYGAIERHLEETLARKDRRALAPSEELLRQWVNRLGLVHSKYTLVTKYSGAGRIPPDGYCPEALILAGVPVPLNFPKAM